MNKEIPDHIAKIKSIDRTLILRENYGETSLSQFKEEYEDLIKKLDIINDYFERVDPDTNNQVSRSLQQLYNTLISLSKLNPEQFVSQKTSLSQQISGYYNEIKKYWPAYSIALIEAKGFFEALNTQNEILNIATEYKLSQIEVMESLKQTAKNIIQEAEKRAQDIESNVRKTAQKVSVKEAQDQFDIACKHHKKQITIWSSITAFLVISFICFIFYLLNVKLEDSWTWKIIYYTTIRVGLLSLIGAILGFSFKILKAHLHMYQHNLHRKLISNSISSFVESASTPEQRDIILNALIQSVVSFGTSGIVDGQDDSTSKITIDNITKSIGGITGS